ncbi:hypothetical protein FB567DRAFT_293704 [Paraphoma chrysanthemicola]|uniref:Uncharacterized protein n=1 Tax=Paraphoma chrysanthemicola TaxID=798071 RepID=A0A8K0RB75_9PLEO|nr:hypothetical protein FB567DRAFT_293704 [Paraphoma chrysanthemicola]
MYAPAEDNIAEKSEECDTEVTPPGGSFDQIPPPMSNGTYSESLTRLQNGYLHAISTLEGHITDLQRDLAKANTHNENCDGRTSQDTARRITELDNENEYLRLELDAQKTKANAYRAELRGLNVTLETKNAVRRQHVSKILHLEQENRRLKEEIRAGRRTGTRMGSESAMRGEMGRGGGGRTEGGAEEMRKRKRLDNDGGYRGRSYDDPVVL